MVAGRNINMYCNIYFLCAKPVMALASSVYYSKYLEMFCSFMPKTREDIAWFFLLERVSLFDLRMMSLAWKCKQFGFISKKVIETYARFTIYGQNGHFIKFRIEVVFHKGTSHDHLFVLKKKTNKQKNKTRLPFKVVLVNNSNINY